ncbi:MAG: hypothetical protein U0414_35060 [Polyangiaceae bacterium]
MNRLDLAPLALVLSSLGCGGATEPPVPVDVAPMVTAKATAAHTGAVVRAPRVSEGSLFRALPGDCESRAYVHVEALLGRTGAAALESMMDAMLRTVRGKPMARGGNATAEPEARPSIGAVREIAFCLLKGGPIAAIRLDPSELRTDLADAFVALFASGGLEARREQRADVTYVLAGDQASVAILGDVALVGAKADALADGIMLGAGSHGFDEASSYVGWLQTADTYGGLTQANQTFRLHFLMKPPDRDREQFAKDPAAVIQAMRASLDQLKKSIATSPIKPAQPILENMTIERAGDQISIDSVFPSNVVADSLAAVGPSSIQEVMALLLR